MTCVFKAAAATPPTAINFKPGVWETEGHWYCSRCEGLARLKGDLPA
jgi:hypothetical protein